MNVEAESPKRPEKRVVSLIASATEIVCALGRRDWMVGRSHECDYPNTVENLPPLTEPKFDVNGTSLQIDERVKGVLELGLSVYRVHADTLKDLRPDVIVTQDQCEVCAASLSDVEEALCDWTDRPANIVSLKPDGMADIWDNIAEVAAALDCAGDGDALVGSLKARMDAVAAKANAISDKPRVACIEWIDPLMAAGNWMPEIVEMAGGVNLFGEAGKHSPYMTWDDLIAADPDVIVVLPCGFGLPRVLEEMEVLRAHPAWAGLKAVKDGRVYATDGNQYFNRPGPRLADSLELLAEILHPAQFDFGFKGTAWVADEPVSA